MGYVTPLLQWLEPLVFCCCYEVRFQKDGWIDRMDGVERASY